MACCGPWGTASEPALNRRELAVAALLCAIAATAWTPAALPGTGVPFAHDLATHHHPWRAWAAARWHAGEVPEWSGAAGFPLLAAGEGGLLYPPTMLLYLLVGDARAMGWSLLLHAAWAGLGLWAYLRATGLRQGPALLGGVAWTGSGWLAAHAVYPGMHAAVAWLAWGLLANRTGNGPLLAVCVGMAGLAGHPQAAAFVGLALLAHAAFGAGPVPTPAVSTVQRAARWLGWSALGVLLAAPQLLATATLAREGLRAGALDDAAAHEGALPVLELARLVLPAAFGWEVAGDVPLHEHRGGAYWGLGASAWEDGVYTGVSVMVLALAGLWRGGRTARGWGWFALAGVLVAVGGPAWEALRALPGMGGFRTPARAMFLPCLAVCVLAAHGAQVLADARRAARARRGTRLAAAGLLGAAVTGTLLLVALGNPLEAALTGRLTRSLAARAPAEASTDPFAARPPPEARSPEAANARARAVIADVRASVDPAGARVLVPVALLLLTGLALALPRRARVPALLLLAGTDLAAFGRATTPLTPLAATRVTAPPPRDPHARVGIVDRRVAQRYALALGAASLNVLVPARDVFVPTPLRFPRWEALVQASGLGLWPAGEAAVTAFAEGLPLARRLGVAEVRSVHDLSAIEGVHALTRDGAVTTWTVEGALPRARVSPCAEVARDDGLPGTDAAALARLRRDPTDGPVLLAPVRDPHARWTGEVPDDRVTVALRTACTRGERPPPVQWVRDDDEAITLRAEGPGWLVLADPWAPGWSATVDGHAETVYRVDLALRGVPLPERGPHTVALRYRTPMLPWP